MPKILAIDTSTDACSCALFLDHKIIDKFSIAPQKHASLILPMVNELLVANKIELNRLDALAFCCGPGSFTGVRLATSIIQGLSLATTLPIIRISALRTLAQEAFTEFKATKVLVAQDARAQEVYWGEYSADNNGIMQAIKPDKLINPRDIKIVDNKKLIGIGNGFEIYRDCFIKKCATISVIANKYVKAKYVAKLAMADLINGLVITVDEAQPVYLREKLFNI
ncbi:MAG: tRNA (adenosine(37)-N6)-threonylcarbamoyltransferase complex dimerization subunit type 1 TsaB [Coxiellaceae bacterium]|jgi:tRNA threonylcarbamoyladenosine biosynthesis protein TsaB|nr:tRNA (adenosine(37)-N6)-threonylcarbamoyltransferase complex dimerization subunit type 1 TsaB [Coxiellaceae bacterium]